MVARISWNQFSKINFKDEDEFGPSYFIAQFQEKENSSPIFIKKDFMKKIAEDEETGAMAFQITVYYNVLSLVYGFDTIILSSNNEIDSAATGENRAYSKSINLYKSLSSEESEIIDFFKNIVEMPSKTRDLIKPLPGLRNNTDNAQNVAISRLPNISNVKRIIDSREETDSNFLFSNLTILENSVYFYSNSIQKSGNSERFIKISNDLKNITIKAFKKSRSEETSEMEIFRKACFNAIKNRKDPAKIFEKVNFLKSYKTQEGFKDLDFIEKEVISSFIVDVGTSLLPPETRLDYLDEDDNYDFLTPLNNITTMVEHHNYKKIEFIYYVLPADDQPSPDLDFSIYLAKSSDRINKKSYTLYNRIDISSLKSELENTADFNASGKEGIESSFTPIFIGDINNEDGDENMEVSAPLRILTSPENDVYFCSRTVSQDTNSNSTFSHQPLLKNRVTDVQKVLTPGDSLNRTIARNTRTGEVSFNSRIFPAKKYKEYSASPLEQSLRSAKVYITTVHHENNAVGLKNQPINKIILRNLPSNLEVVNFFRKYDFQSEKVELPVTLSDSILNDISPIPNEKVTYFIRVRDRISSETTSSRNDLIVKHRTFPSTKNSLSLVIGSISTVTPDLYEIPVEVVDSYALLDDGSRTNLASSLRRNIERLFQNSDEDKEFYDEIIQEKVRSGLDNIKNMYQLHVIEKDTLTGDENSYYLDPNEREDSEDFDTSFFTIEVSAIDTKKLIFYNVVLKNAHDILEDLVENLESSEEDKKIFKRRTSVFFNSISLNSGVLPVQRNIGPNRSTITHTGRHGTMKFQFVTCMGYYAEVGSLERLPHLDVENMSLSQVHSTGEFIIKWKCTSLRPGSSNPRGPEFFVVTVVINGYEIIIGSHPSVGFGDYCYRTQSFLNIAGSVKFRVRPVYNDFRIEKTTIFETEEMEVTDITSFRSVNQVN